MQDDSEADSSDDDTSNPVSQKPKKAKTTTTIEELKRLEETENMYHSNMFRMQIEELLKEVKTSTKLNTFVTDWLSQFNQHLKSLKKGPEKSFPEVIKSTVAYPLITKVQDLSKTVFQFHPPEKAAEVTGGHRFGTNIGGTVDIVVTIPFAMFHKEDYLNERFYHIKAFYLQTLAESLSSQDFVREIRFNYFKNATLRPVLEVFPVSDKIPSNIIFVIHCFAEEKTFKLSRFLPSTNNVRSYFALSEEEILSPTPHYNSGVLFDVTHKTNQDFMDDLLENHQSIRDAIILLKIWTKQRHFDEGFYPFNGHLITLYVCYLLKTEKIFPAMSSYQIIRLFWFNLSKSEWNKEGPMLCPLSMDMKSSCLEKFHQHFDLVFVDSTGYLNVCANLALELYGRVKVEAGRAIKCLDSKTGDSFQYLFMRKMPPYLQYDQILT